MEKWIPNATQPFNPTESAYVITVGFSPPTPPPPPLLWCGCGAWGQGVEVFAGFGFRPQLKGRCEVAGFGV